MLPATQMNTALLKAYYSSKKEEFSADLLSKLEENLTSKNKFIQKIKGLDTLLKAHGIPEDIGEMLFDILLYHFFSEDSQRLGEQFFESEEWEIIEDAIIDRGTELMNLLLYLQECKDSGIKYSLEDYLDEYLIAEDDFDQEEHEVYEAIIKNRDQITDGDIETLVSISNSNTESALGDQLLPLLLFFDPNTTNDKKIIAISTNGSNPVFQNSFLAVLNIF